jgi:hypothetical protein
LRDGAPRREHSSGISSDPTLAGHPQVPKRGACTPRYLLKLRTEVEIMQQLGYSLDAVNLKV